MAAAAQPVPGFYEQTTIGNLGVGNIFRAADGTILLVTDIQQTGDALTRNVSGRELNQVDKIFGEIETSIIANNTPITRVNCPQPAPAAAPPAIATSGGASRRKRSTSRNRRKLRKT